METENEKTRQSKEPPVSFVILWDILDAATGHLQQHQSRRRALVPIESSQLALVHFCGGFVVRHEDEASQVRPLLDEFFQTLHHPAGKPAPLELFKDKDVGEIGKCDVVGHDASEADELYIRSVWSPRRSAFYWTQKKNCQLVKYNEFGELNPHRDDKKGQKD